MVFLFIVAPVEIMLKQQRINLGSGIQASKGFFLGRGVQVNNENIFLLKCEIDNCEGTTTLYQGTLN